MTTEATRSIVSQYFEAVLSRATPETLAAFFSDDAEWDIPGDVDHVPWIGPRVGRGGVEDFVRALRAQTEPIHFDVRSLVVDGEKAVALGDLESRAKRTGKTMKSPFSIEFTVRDGSIRLYRFLEDSFAIAQALVVEPDPRQEILREYFRRIDTRDPRLVDLFTEDVEIVFPKFGRARGKDAIARFGRVLARQLESLEHDIEGLRFIVSKDLIAVEGQERGVMRDGTRWPDGVISEGRFCDVFEFEGSLIRRIFIYVDPDFTNADGERLRALRSSTDSV